MILSNSDVRICGQLFDMVNIGLVILDQNLAVYRWNRWMVRHSGIEAEQVVGKSLLELFPNLNSPKFIRSCKSVLGFGNFAFFSQKLHHQLFPFPPISNFIADFTLMEQNCTLGPLRDENNKISYLYISVEDVTEAVSYEKMLTELNQRDGLTGIFNRRALEKRLREEVERHRRHGRSLSLMMCDIDFFKKINDVYGHPCGDYILRSVAGIIATEIRKVDFVARYGGEEFCVLFIETELESAKIVAERIRHTIAATEFLFEKKNIHVTMSFGLDELAFTVQSPDELVKNADRALYFAKHAGRNRVVVAADLPEKESDPSS